MSSLRSRDVIRIALVLGFVQCIVFAPYLFFGKTLLSSATQVPSIYPSGAAGRNPHASIYRVLDAGAPAWQSEPWLQMVHRQIFDQHVLPMWDPDDAYGKPFAAGMQAQPFFPLNFLAAIAPSPTTYNWYIVVRLFMAGLFAALYVRLWTQTIAAIGAGIAEAFSGYFMLYMNMPHLSVETLIPAVIFCTELYVRRPQSRSIGWLAVATALIFLGGMPESAVLALTLGAVYFMFRLLLKRLNPRKALTAVSGYVAALAIGGAVGGIVLVPFLEYLRDSFDTHQLQNVGGALAGLGADGYFKQGLLLELMPLALGPPWNNIENGFQGFTLARGAVGLLPVFLSVIGLSTLIRRPLRWSARDAVSVFFLTTAAFCLAKRFGSPLAQWFGYVPVYRIVSMVKYLEPLTAFSVSVLCGFGLAVVLERRAQKTHVVASAIVVLWALTAFYLDAVEKKVSDATPHVVFLTYAIVLGLSALSTTIALCLAAVSVPAARRRFLGCAVALIAIELPCEFFVPIHYIATKPDPASANPYLGAPYVNFLRARTADDNSRIFAVSGWLFPNWGAASGLHDVRALDGMNVREYMNFVDAFLAPVRPLSDDLFDRFTGTYPVDLSLPLAQRWLAMSSVRFIVSPNAIVPSTNDGLLTELWAQNAASVPDDHKSAVHLAQYSIGGTGERVLFEHPPYNAIVFHTIVSPSEPIFIADIAFAPDVYRGAVCGDGVTFGLTAAVGSRQIVRETRYIDPKHRIDERRWIPFAIDLRAVAGKPVDIRFSTSPGPSGQLCADWSIWGQPRFAKAGAIQAFVPPRGNDFISVYNDDASIQEYQHPMPRATILHETAIVREPAQALEAITAKRFDPRSTAIVSGDVTSIPVGASHGNDSAHIIAQKANRVEIDADSASAGLLVLNDTYYPGWTATIDGAQTPIYRTDYLFRGIEMPAGKHRVVFAYRSGAVTLGLFLTLSGLFVLLLILCIPQKRWAQFSLRN